jgi:large subunit ribosomal protein L7Ae
MSKPLFVHFDVTDELVKEAYNILEIARDSGEIKKGIYNTINAVEKRKGKLVIIAEDVEPPEVVYHLPILCEKKDIPYTYVPSKYTLGEKCGIDLPAAAACIIDLGNASEPYKSFLVKLKRVREERSIEHPKYMYQEQKQKSFIEKMRDHLPF